MEKWDMANERMPDFREIDRLVGSLRALDEHFGRIVPDTARRKQKVVQGCREMLKENAAGSLNEIPVEEYDTVFVGYPMWWYTFPMILYTFFDKYDFSGKTIVPFNTHMGSGDGGTYRTIKELEPKATVLAGLPLEMSDAERGNPKAVSKWLEELGLK